VDKHPFFTKLEGPYRDFIPDFQEYVLHLKGQLPSYVRINTLKIGVEEAVRFLEGEGLKTWRTPVDDMLLLEGQPRIPALSYHLGLIYPQALSSALPVLAMDLKMGQTVLDLCAAPGGKTGHIAQLMGDSGAIVANDRKLGRVTSLMSNLKRLGITSAVVTQCRGEHFTWPSLFHRVLVDAPCSGEGKYRIDPETGQLKHARMGRTNLPAIQKALIQRGFDMLRPGGVLIYSTCTLDPEENEGVVAHLLKKRDARLLKWRPPVESSPGLTSYMEKEYGEELRLAHRFYPHKIGSVGFFVAKIAGRP